MTTKSLMICDRCDKEIEYDPDEGATPRGWFRVEVWTREAESNSQGHHKDELAHEWDFCERCLVAIEGAVDTSPEEIITIDDKGRVHAPQ